MRGERKILVAVLLCALTLLFTACGGESGKSGADGGNVILEQRLNENLVYYKSDLNLGLKADVSYVDFKVYGQNIYYPEGKNIVFYSPTDSEKSVDTFQWENAPGEWSFCRVCYSRLGEIYAIVNVQNTYYLCKFDMERKPLFAMDLGQYYKDAGESFSDDCRLEAGNDGRIYLSNTGVLWIFESDGSYKGKVSFGDAKDVWVRDLQSSAEGKLYVLYDDKATEEQYVAEIDTEKGAVTARQKTIGLTGISVLGENLLAYSGAVTYTYDREARALTELFKWTECSIKEMTVYRARQLADGSIFAVGQLSGGGVTSFVVKSMLVGGSVISDSGKIDIRLAQLFSASTELMLAVNRFNNSNEMYHIVLETYGSESKEEGIARLKAEIAAGNGPDIIDMRFGLEKSLTEDGYLEDLSMWLAESDVISEGDFLNFALEEYRVDGMLVAIPHRCALMTLIGNSDVLGWESGWTMEEMVEFFEGQGGNSVFADGDHMRSILWAILRLNEGYFVDKNACTCNFDNDIFRRIVEIGEYYPLDYDVAPEVTDSRQTLLQSGNAILVSESISNFMDLQVFEHILGGSMNCIGFPVEDGVGVMASTYDALGISALSEYKDVAWEFLESFLQMMREEKRSSYFPTYVPNLDKMAENYLNLANPGYTTSVKDNFRYDFHTPTPEEVEQYYAMIEVARIGSSDVGLVNLILEELGTYYDGEKTMDEMIASLESRVEVYLEESR